MWTTTPTTSSIGRTACIGSPSRYSNRRRMRWNISAACLAAWSGLVVFSLLLPAQAQVNLTGGTMTPAVGPYDQSYLPGAVVEGTDTIGSPFGYSGDNDQYSYISSPDRTSKAQSFIFLRSIHL